MRFLVLGPLRIQNKERTIDLRARPRLVLLAVLLSRAGRPVSVPELIDALWPVAPPSNAVKDLQSYISRLKRDLGEPGRISLGQAGYLIALRQGEFDAEEFADHLRGAKVSGRGGDTALAAAFLDQALGLWRGSPYHGLEDCPFLVPEIGRLQELRLQALEDWADITLHRGLHAEVVPDLSALVAEHPHRERFSALLMLALYRSGRQAEALETYRRTHASLVENLGIEPGRALRHLHDQILRSDRALDLRSEVATAPGHPPAQLPPDLVSFTGRERELEALLAAVRVGPGGRRMPISAIDGMAGIGKTALAVRAAHRLVYRYPDGQLFLDLHGFTEGVESLKPWNALDRLLRAIGIPGEQIPLDLDERVALWQTQLADKRMLIVLDNAAAEDQVRPLLPASSGCLVLVTSRWRFNDLDDIHTLSLDVLPTADAKELFRAVCQERVVAEPDELIHEAVELCGCLPLAIRLLAMKLRHRPNWSLADLVARMQDTCERLPQLEAGRRSVAGALELSYQNLKADQQRGFRLLGLHPAPDFDVYAATALMSLPLREAEKILEELVDVHIVDNRAYGRYTFHDLLRLHAADIANDHESETERRAALTRLLDYYLCTAVQATKVIMPTDPHRPDVPKRMSPGPSLTDHGEAKAWLNLERANLIAVARYSADHGWPRYAIHFSECLHPYLHDGLYAADALVLHQAALKAARTQYDCTAEAVAMGRMGMAYRTMAVHDEALSILNQALGRLPASDDGKYRAFLTFELGEALVHVGRFHDARTYCRQALDLFRTQQNLVGQARVMCVLGEVERYLGHLADAEECQRLAVGIARETSDRLAEGWAYRHLGVAQCATKRYVEALNSLRYSLDCFREVGSWAGEYRALIGMSWALRGLGRHSDSLECAARIMKIARGHNDRNCELEACKELGFTLLTAGKAEQALAHFRIALQLANELKQAYDQGRTHESLGDTFLDLGNIDRAREHWMEALEIYRQLGLPGAERVAQQLQV